MKKSKLALLLALAALTAACAESFVSVQVPFNKPLAADFGAYQGLFFIDFICDVPADAGINAEAEVRRAFTEEIPFTAGRKVTLLAPDHWDAIRTLLRHYRLAVDVQYENSLYFQKVFRAHPRALFFTGKLKLGIKKMGVVKETRDEKGDMKNAYETMQLWEMEVKVDLIDGDSNTPLWHEKYTEKAEPGPALSPQFSFNSLFARITSKLAADIQPRRTLQERFILAK